VKVVLAVCVAVLLAACGGQRPSAYARRDIRAEEILMLDGKIMDYRKELGLAPRPDPFLISQVRGQARLALPPPTPQNASEQCLDVCELSVYICRASDDICRIADELGPDDWAAAKCASARASCKEARKRCTDCQ
jgi:hypothetical protein